MRNDITETYEQQKCLKTFRPKNWCVTNSSHFECQFFTPYIFYHWPNRVAAWWLFMVLWLLFVVPTIVRRKSSNIPAKLRRLNLKDSLITSLSNVTRTSRPPFRFCRWLNNVEKSEIKSHQCYINVQKYIRMFHSEKQVTDENIFFLILLFKLSTMTFPVSYPRLGVTAISFQFQIMLKSQKIIKTSL